MILREILVKAIAEISRFIHVKDVRGEDFIIQDRKFTPVSRNIWIGGQGKSGGGGLFWKRPIAITEEIGDGIYRHYPIRDETLKIILSVIVSTIVFRAVTSLLVRGR